MARRLATIAVLGLTLTLVGGIVPGSVPPAAASCNGLEGGCGCPDPNNPEVADAYVDCPFEFDWGVWFPPIAGVVVVGGLATLFVIGRRPRSRTSSTWEDEDGAA